MRVESAWVLLLQFCAQCASQLVFESGPRVPNAAWRGHCSVEKYDLAEAKTHCEASNCTAIHDYACDDKLWRVCHASMEDMQSQGSGTGACTMVPEYCGELCENPCECLEHWEYNGDTYDGCTPTPDYQVPWCYVVSGACESASESTTSPGRYWQECVDPCACKESWPYLGEEYMGCDMTPDFTTDHWCYVVGGHECHGAMESTETPGEYWHTCEDDCAFLCEDDCKCSESWSYMDHTYHGCDATPDTDGTWCYVVGKEHCASAAESTINPGEYWQACENPNCQCKDEWHWDDTHYSGCAVIDDYAWCYASGGSDCPLAAESTVNAGEFWLECEAKYPCECKDSWSWMARDYTGCAEVDGASWCYVVDGEHCESATASTVNVGEHWLQCDPCACKMSWTFEHMQHHGCYEPNPVFPWCYVSGGRYCEGAIASTTDVGESWLPCGGDIGGVMPAGACRCKDSWDWMGETHERCETIDGASWCYVAGGSDCSSASASTVNAGEYWVSCRVEEDLLIDGPRVPNTAHRQHCDPRTYTLEEAARECYNTDCTVLHDFDCDGVLWRVCHSTIEAMESVSDDRKACTKLNDPSCGSELCDEPCECLEEWTWGDSHLTGCAMTPDYHEPWCQVVDGHSCPGAQKSETTDSYWRPCSTMIPGPNVPDAAFEEPYCEPHLHPTVEEAMHACLDHDECVALHDYACDGRGWRTCSASLLAMREAGSDSNACTMIKPRTVPMLPGPNVPNQAHVEGCAPGLHTLAEAMEMCDQLQCTALHDFDCNGVGWRVCHESIEHMQSHGSDSLACTMVPDDQCDLCDEPCECLDSWEYLGHTYEGCTPTPDYSVPWCYVASSACGSAKESTTSPGHFWQECEDPCACQESWSWEHESYQGCATTPDYASSWCYVSGGSHCGSATKSTHVPDLYYRDCMDPCACQDSWSYLGSTYEGCATTPDWTDASWCYVAGGAHCHDAKESTTNPGEYWRECDACACQDSWSYLGSTYEGCATTPDWTDASWCYVAGGAHCHDAQESTTNPGEYWRECDLCACQDSWSYLGSHYEGCATTPDWTDSHWCYVVGGSHCDGAKESTVAPGEYWHECTTTPGVSFVPGPHMPNAAAQLCGTPVSTLEEAKSLCVQQGCYALHDFQCDGEMWRVCSNTTTAAMMAMGSDTRACTLLAVPDRTWEEGPHVDNGARDSCSTEWYSLEEAKERCTAGCYALHDFACNGVGWRICSDSTIEAMMAEGPGSDACTYIPTGTYEPPQTTAEPEPEPCPNYVSGPAVSNNYPALGCAEEFYVLEEAQCRCKEQGCTVLHDFSCDGTGWRLCFGMGSAAMEAASSDSLACTRVNTDVEPPTTQATTVPSAADFVRGPNVDNRIAASCSTHLYTLEEAEAVCVASGDCQFLHDFNCDGYSWRVCLGSMPGMVNQWTGTKACTMVKTGSEPATTTEGVPYSDGGAVPNGAAAQCSPNYYDLAEAKDRCNANPSCFALHDFSCDGNGWRVCTSGSMATLLAVGSDRSACTLVPEGVAPATTTEAAVTFSGGPHVSNTAREHCSTAHYALEEAEGLCAQSACFALHDFNCDGRGWRVCSGATIGDMLAGGGPDTRACTLVPN